MVCIACTRQRECSAVNQIYVVTFLDRRYIGSPRGSSFVELERAVDRVGLHSLAFTNLSVRDLRASPYLLVLHVRSTPWVDDYDHFVLFTGVDRDDALIFDVASGLSRVPLSSLGRVWSGNGIAVSDTRVKAGTLFRRSRQVVVLTILFAGSLIVLWRAVRPLARLERSVRIGPLAAVELAVILATGSLIGYGYHRATDAGFLAVAGATRDVEQWHTDAYLDVLSFEALTDAIHRGNLVIIDARSPEQYDEGHIPGAMRCSFDDLPRFQSHALFGTPRDRPVVVYCESASCRAANLVARGLSLRGFRSVAVFREGWSEWKRHRQ